MFADREDAGRLLAEAFKGRKVRQPLVLAIPRGGIVPAAVLARALRAELDVALARKLRAPGNPELALGAVGEDGAVCLSERGAVEPRGQGHLHRETRTQKREIARRRRLFRGDRPPAPLRGRSVIVVDDGIATGSTMTAALQAARAQEPFELIVAVPVAAPDRLERLRPLCDDVVCLLPAPELQAVGQFYADFTQVEDQEVVRLLDEARARSPKTA